MSYDEHLISMAGGDGEPDTLDLDAIQARVNAATEGPWDFEPIDGQFGVYSLEMQDNGDYPAVIGYPSEGGAEADADFSAHARTDVPALLALVRSQQAQIERVRELHVSSGGHNPSCHCGVPAGSGANCVECGDAWPCPTIAALTATEGAA